MKTNKFTVRMLAVALLLVFCEGRGVFGQQQKQKQEHHQVMEDHVKQRAELKEHLEESQKNVREIILNEDRDQTYFRTVVYELKHISAADITPWILGAVKRNNPDSDVQRLKYKKGHKEYIVVTMDEDMIPYVNAMVKALDIPGKKDANNSIVDGTGIHHFIFQPEHRATDEMLHIAKTILGSGDGAHFLNTNTNMFYWKDSDSDGHTVLKWLKFFDRPAPQVQIRFHVYELTDNDFKELGIDFIGWKNGPGANLFGFGADFWNFRSKEQFLAQAIEKMANLSTSWAGVVFAPQFDASFLRLLAQKGKAKTASSASLVIMNNPDGSYALRFTPEFQNIAKDKDMGISIEGSSGDEIEVTINRPVICFDNSGNTSLRLRFNYEIDFASVVERNNTGTEFGNTSIVSSDLTLECGTEKLLAEFTREHDVEQNNGIPFLCDIPVIKYFVGTVTHSRAYAKYFITVKAEALSPDSELSKWAGKIITQSQINWKYSKKEKQNK